jgi:hypothetical protein
MLAGLKAWVLAAVFFAVSVAYTIGFWLAGGFRKGRWAITVALILAGCTTATVHVEYDENGRPRTCTASYGSLFKTVEGADVTACDAHAHSTKAEVRTELIQYLLGAAK